MKLKSQINNLIGVNVCTLVIIALVAFAEVSISDKAMFISFISIVCISANILILLGDNNLRSAIRNYDKMNKFNSSTIKNNQP